MSSFESEYRQLTSAAGLVDFAHRTRIEVTGKDRQSLLHNLCTNDVVGLRPGDGCEAFLTNVQGKTVGHVLLLCGAERLVLETVGDQAETILPHIDRYIIREDVELVDRSDEWNEILLSGPLAEQVLGRLDVGPLPASRLAHVEAELGGPISLCRVDLAGPVGFLLRFARAGGDAVGAALEKAGAEWCQEQAFQAARIEWGTPLYGHDMSDANLPQEVGRNEQAISFTKGCYLGQETVARIDALGHVNKMLCGVRFLGADVPPVATALAAGGKEVGHVTSATLSPKLGGPLALAYVRRGHNEPGARLSSALGDAEVVKLPA